MRLLVDADVLLYKAAHAGRTEIEWEPGVFSLSLDVNLAAARAYDLLEEWKEALGADSALLAFSDPRRKYFRHELEPSYKAGRSTQMPGWAALVAAISEGEEAITWPRLEADDVLGILATMPGSEDDVIVSIDKDFRGVPCRLWNPDKPELGVETITEDEANRFHLEQALIGDRVDGYFGCPGIGKVRAARILDEDLVPNYWNAVVAAFVSAGQTPEDALLQARLAYLLRADNYDLQTGAVKLWEPPA